MALVGENEIKPGAVAKAGKLLAMPYPTPEGRVSADREASAAFEVVHRHEPAVTDTARK